MPRQPRFFLPDVPLHVIQRGNDRSAMFVELDDYSFFHRRLCIAAQKCGVTVHSYVLMTNHVHLLATPRQATSMPKMMQSVGRIFVQYFNTKYRRTGTRWEGRYKATAVHDDSYLFACMRYIELNPVRAGIVNDPRGYRWSSFRANAVGNVDELVVPHPLYRSLGASRAERLKAYRELFDLPVPESELNAIRDATQHAWALGDEHFRRRITEFNRRAARLPTGRRRLPVGAMPVETT